ncbi:ribose 5-phosphate isomerase B [Candidatus Pacearchaeota archaeon]|nr:ribose 5-phosphate isomerase B [Candidatus Pacearchaeota archaeon]
MENIVLAADHNGVLLKSHLHSHLKKKGYNPIDLGPYDELNKVDYTDYASQLGKIIHIGDVSRGILICGTGVGMSIAANRFANVRAALVHNLETAPKCREHNDSNVLCMGSWNTTHQIAEQILDNWLCTPFGEGRHVKRVEKISEPRPNSIIFTNGIFDVLHKGHIELLRFSKSLGDKLIVGINSDNTTKIIKGENRPLNSELDRKALLESIYEVDEVVVFDDLEPLNIIKKINPHIVVKGGEWTSDEVRKRDKIPDHMKIKIFPMIKSYSTNETIKKIQDL